MIENNTKMVENNTQSLRIPPIASGGEPIESPISYISESKFRIKAKKVFYTYKTHIDFEEWLMWIDSKHKVKQWIGCHETSDSHHSYEHSHFAVEFENSIDSTNPRHFDWGDIHPNIAPIRNWIAAVTYCTKQKPTPICKANFDIPSFLKKNRRKYKRNNPEENINDLCDRIAKHKNAYDAVKNEAKSLKDVQAVIAIYNNKNYSIDERLLKKTESMVLYPWQQVLYNIILQEPDNRHIYWIYDKIGRKGKTMFTTYCRIKHRDNCLVLSSSGSLRDIADIIRNWMDSGAVPNTVLIDLPRTFEDRDSIYTVLESVKNGIITCTKYKGSTLLFNPPHVIVFSNWCPKIDKLSRDRWILKRLIGNNGEYKMINIRIPIKNDSEDSMEDSIELSEEKVNRSINKNIDRIENIDF